MDTINADISHTLMQKRVVRGFCISVLHYLIALLMITVPIALGIEYISPVGLNATSLARQPLSQYLINYANLLMMGSTVLYLAYAWIAAPMLGKLATTLAAISLAGITLALLMRFVGASFLHRPEVNNFSGVYDVITLCSAIALAIYLSMEKVYRTRAAGAWVMPVILTTVLLENFQAVYEQSGMRNWFIVLNTYWINALSLSIFIGYFSFAMSALFGLFYLVRSGPESSKATDELSTEPHHFSNSTDVLVVSIAVGLCFHTFAIFLGIAWSYVQSVSIWTWSEKYIDIMFIYSIYSLFLICQRAWHWTDSTKAWLSLVFILITILT